MTPYRWPNDPRMVNRKVEETRPIIKRTGYGNSNWTEKIANAKQNKVNTKLITRYNKRVSISVKAAATTPKVNGITALILPKYHGINVLPAKLMTIRML